MTREPIETRGEVDEQIELRVGLHLGGDIAQLGLRLQCLPEVGGVEPPDVLRDLIDLLGGETEGGAGVADGSARTIGRLHRQQRHPVVAIPIEHCPVDVVSAGGLDVDIDIWQRAAGVAEEPLGEQMVFDRVDGGDTQQVVDETTGAGPARLHPDAHVPDEFDDVSDREEIRFEPEVPDRAQLILEAIPDATQIGILRVRVPIGDRVEAAPTQYPDRIRAGHPDSLGLRDLGLPPPQIRIRVETALVSDPLSVGEEVQGVGSAQPRVLGDQTGKAMHLGRGFQPGLRGLQLKTAERLEEGGGIEDVAGDRILRAEEPHGVRQHRRNTRGAGELEHVRGVFETRGRSGVRVVADDLHDDSPR